MNEPHRHDWRRLPALDTAGAFRFRCALCRAIGWRQKGTRWPVRAMKAPEGEIRRAAAEAQEKERRALSATDYRPRDTGATESAVNDDIFDENPRAAWVYGLWGRRGR